MRQYVDIEGSGRGITTVLGEGDGSTIQLASNSELRDLSVLNRHPSNSYGIFGYSGTSGTRVSKVAVDAWPAGGGASYVSGMILSALGGDPLTLDDVTVRAHGGNSGDAIYIAGSQAQLVVLRHVWAEISSLGNGGGNSVLVGNGWFSFQDSTFTAACNAGGWCKGLMTDAGTTKIDLRNVTLFSQHSTGQAVGANLTGGVAVNFYNCQILPQGQTTAHGIVVPDAPITLRNTSLAVAVATPGGSGYGLLFMQTSTKPARIEQSQIEAPLSAVVINSGASVPVTILGSTLVGGVGSPSVTCAGVVPVELNARQFHSWPVQCARPRAAA